MLSHFLMACVFKKNLILGQNQAKAKNETLGQLNFFTYKIRTADLHETGFLNIDRDFLFHTQNYSQHILDARLNQMVKKVQLCQLESLDMAINI